MDFRKIRDKCISAQVRLWLDEVTLVHFQQVGVENDHEDHTQLKIDEKQ